METRNALTVLAAIAVSFGVSVIVAYLLVRMYCEAAEVVYLMREDQGTGDDAPAPTDVNAMMNEVRRFIREAGNGRGVG